ncbi:hypothetical protein ACTWPT_16745, partial [Nonomuraea sp. 3N208]
VMALSLSLPLGGGQCAVSQVPHDRSQLSHQVGVAVVGQVGQGMCPYRLPYRPGRWAGASCEIWGCHRNTVAARQELLGQRLSDGVADPVANLVGYQQHAVWLTRGELEEIISEFRRVILPLPTNQPTPAQPIFFPVEQPPCRAPPRVESGGGWRRHTPVRRMLSS